MSPSDTIHLVIEGATQATEIELQDASYHAVSLDQNAGRAEAEVRPGIYKVTYREGDSLLQENVLVTGGETKIVRQSEGAPIVSAIPIVDSPTSNEWQRSSAERLSRQSHFDLGGEAGLFVFVRDVGVPSLAPPNARPSQRSSRPEWPTADRIASGNVATGLTLRSADGAMLYDYAVGPGDLQHHWAGAAGRLPSGTYLLRVETATGDAFEMPVAVRPGWQTQVFSFTYSSGERDGDRRADLSKTSVAMARQGQGFVASDPMLRIGEQALQALARRREIRSRELDSLLASEHQNPILGIVGAHLLRLRFDLDRSHFQHVVDVLFNLTSDERHGPHPDVAALRLGRDDVAVRPFDLPPMLKRSWALLQVESHRRDGVVPEGSLSAFIGARMWSPGPWIVSRAPRSDRTTRLPGAAPRVGAPKAQSSGPVESAIDAVYRLLADDARTKRLFEARDIGALERQVALSIRSTREGNAPPPSEAEIAYALRIPPATLPVLLARLRQFLGDHE